MVAQLKSLTPRGNKESSVNAIMKDHLHFRNKMGCDHSLVGEAGK